MLNEHETTGLVELIRQEVKEKTRYIFQYIVGEFL
jgi:hypothetical protein